MATATTHPTAPNPDNARATSSVAAKAMIRLAAQWGLTEAQLATLMSLSVPTIQRWKKQVRASGQLATTLGPDTLDRISYLLGIYKALHLLFSDDDQANGWIKRANSNPTFAGITPLDYMLQGHMHHLSHVRRHLDGWRG